MEPELAAKTIRALRGLTDKPINVNFFCHVQAKTATDREEAWRDRLLPYYREHGIDHQRLTFFLSFSLIATRRRACDEHLYRTSY
jgi:hypothetical protein